MLLELIVNNILFTILRDMNKEQGYFLDSLQGRERMCINWILF